MKLSWLFSLVCLLTACGNPVPDHAEPGIYRGVLPNGLRVDFCPSPGAVDLSVKLAVRTSYRDEPTGREGLRLLANMTQLHHDDFCRDCEELGGWWDPTNYYPEVSSKDFCVTPGQLEPAISLLGDMLKRMTTMTDDKIRQDLADWMDHKSVFSDNKTSQYSTLDATDFVEPFRWNDPRGRRPVVAEIDEEEYLQFTRDVFQPSRCTVTLTGAFDPHIAWNLIREHLGSFRDRPPAAEPRVFSGFLAGRHVQRYAPAPAVMVGHLVPGHLRSLDVHLVARLLETHLKRLAPPEGLTVSAALRPGLDLVKIRVPRPTDTLRQNLIEGSWDPAQFITAETLQAHQRRFATDIFRNRLTNAYWNSWSVAFDSDRLWDPVLAPWQVFDATLATEVETLRHVARQLLAAGHVVVEEGPEFMPAAET
ncbi:MAG: hypothetical protein Q8R28_22270, partial [Dehalococcoidia bacterium]|nr:hypothetical protein [Dehalococcoidia bacterium]